MKIPVLGVIGAREAETRSVSLRSRRQGDLGSVDGASLAMAGSMANRERLATLALA
jgi:threonyl-tRNA synthetase